MMNNQELLEYIWNNFSSYIQESYHKICALRVVGSRGLGIIDDRSDYDIEVYLWDKNYSESPYYNLFYKNKRVHWYYHNPKDWLSPKDLNICLFYSGLADLCFLSRENWLSCNPIGENLFNILDENKKFLSQLGCKKILNYNSEQLAKIKTPQDLLKNSSKIFYHKIKSWLVLKGEELPKNYLLQIKRIRWRPIPQEIITWGFDIINQINSYSSLYHISEEEKNNFNRLWRNYGHNICK